ncbi:hypothetical protein, partial [Morganella morganii]
HSLRVLISPTQYKHQYYQLVTSVFIAHINSKLN